MSRDDRPTLYAALGDSISIDEYAGGPGLGGPSLFARNRDDVFPQWRGRDLATVHPDLRYHLLAVDGGTTDSLLHHQLPQLERSGGALRGDPHRRRQRPAGRLRRHTSRTTGRRGRATTRRRGPPPAPAPHAGAERPDHRRD